VTSFLLPQVLNSRTSASGPSMAHLFLASASKVETIRTSRQARGASLVILGLFLLSLSPHQPRSHLLAHLPLARGICSLPQLTRPSDYGPATPGHALWRIAVTMRRSGTFDGVLTDTTSCHVVTTKLRVSGRPNILLPCECLLATMVMSTSVASTPTALMSSLEVIRT
jgi:hypothetical protein